MKENHQASVTLNMKCSDNVLMKNKLSFKSISMIKSMYNDLYLSVKLTAGTTPFFNSDVGVRQGCNLSPMLFNLFINDLVEYLQSDITETVRLNEYSCNCLMYADDLLLLSKSWEDLCQTMDKLGSYCVQWKLNISSKKTKIVFFGKNVKRTGLTHNIGNVTIPRNNNDTHKSSVKCKTHLFKQANKAILRFLKQVNTQNGGKASAIVKLFYSLVVPVLLYNSEVWGRFMRSKSSHNLEKLKNNLFDESHKHEQLLNRICKYTLGIPKKSSNIAAKGKLGIYHLNIEVCVRIVKFFFHLLKLIKGGNKLIYSAVMECYTLWKCGDNLSKELNILSWLSTVFYLLQIAGYNFPSVSNYLEIDEGITVKNLKTELQKLYRQLFFKTISLSSKLAPIYGKIKKEYREKPYVSQEYHKYKSATTRFRISAHNLPIEKGRWEGIDKSERKCKKCINNDVGDEKHYILYCNVPEIVDLRVKFFTGNKLTRVSGENARSFIEGILSVRQGTPHLIGKISSWGY